MEELTFKNNLSEELIDDFSSIHDRCIGEDCNANANLRIYYNKEGNFHKGYFYEIVPVAEKKYHHSLEAVLVLSHVLFDYINNKPRFLTKGIDYEKKVFRYNYSSEPEIGNLSDFLLKLEKFLSEIIFLLHPVEFEEASKKHKFGLDDVMNFEKKFPSNPMGFIDKDLSPISEIAYTLRKYRNNDQHPFGNPAFSIPSCLRGGETCREILNSITSFIILVIWYRYDDIYDALEKNGAFTPEGVAIKGAETLESYIGKLKNEQFNIINYKIYKSSDKSSLKQIIDVNLKFHTNSKEEGNEDSEESLVNASKLIDDPDEHFTLLAGESGAGKTTMLAYMIDRVIASWEQDKENMPLPIKIDFENKLIIKGESGVDIYQYHSLFDHILVNIALEEKIELTNEKLNPIRIYLKQLLETGKCILFIEGLNEIVQRDSEGNNISYGLRKQIINDILDFSVIYPQVRYFVTTRISGIDTNEQGTIGHFKRYNLQPLDDLQIQTQINNYNRIVSEEQNNNENNNEYLWDKIKDHKIGELAQNPMQLVQIVELFRDKEIKEQDFDIPISKLYRALIEERLVKKANYKAPKDQDYKGLILLINNLLRVIAKEMFEKQCRSIDYESIALRGDDIITISTITTIEELLKISSSLYVLTLKNGEYSFEHDSWQEYYLAYDFAQQIKGCKDNAEELRTTIRTIGKVPQDFQKQEMMNILRETFEILETEWFYGCREDRDNNIKKCQKKIDEIGLVDDENDYDPELIKKTNERNDLLEKIEKYNKTYAEKTNNGRRRMSKFSLALLSLGEDKEEETISKVNPILPVLAYATSTIKDELWNNDVKTPGDNYINIQPKEMIRQVVSSLLVTFKNTNINGFSDTDPNVVTAQVNDHLKPIFTCIALMNDEKLLDSIFTPYWLRLWIIKPLDERKLFKKNWNRTTALNVLTGIMIEHSTNRLLLYQKLYEIYKRMVVMNLLETAAHLERIMMRILLKLRDEQIIKVIDSLTYQEADEIEQVINRKLSANAILVLNNVDVMKNKLNEINSRMQKDNINFEYRFRSAIHLKAASKLMTKFDKPYVQDIVIGKEWSEKGKEQPEEKILIGLLEDLPVGSDIHLMVLNSVLMRHGMIGPEKQEILEKYLVCDDGKNIMRQHPECLDLLPLEKIPRYYKAAYDQEVLKLSEQKEGPYRVTKVYYQEITSNNKKIAVIPLPSKSDDVSSLFVRFDGDGEFHKVQKVDMSTEEQRQYSNRPLLSIEKQPDNGIREGYIEFFADKDGVYTKAIAFDNLIDIVRINHPEMYHASICHKLVKSCANNRDVKDLYYFCKKKSCSIEIVYKYLKGVIKEWDMSIPNVCVVLETSASQTNLFSPSRSGILNNYDPQKYRTGSFFSNYPTPLSTGINKGDFVVHEKNGKIYPLDNKTIKEKRGMTLGFIEGTVKKRDDKLVVIVKDNLKYPFYMSKDTDTTLLSADDKVSFFPSIDYENKKLICSALYIEKLTNE